MEFSPVFLQQFKNTVERILHVKGNYNGGILEMAVILDHHLSREAVQEMVPVLLRTLKMHSEVFRNVRLNLVDWIGEDCIENEVSPMSVAMLPQFYEKYEMREEQKTMSSLAEYLKLFQARAKLLILVTDGAFETGGGELLQQSMQPFLEKKLMQVVIREGTGEIRYR